MQRKAAERREEVLSDLPSTCFFATFRQVPQAPPGAAREEREVVVAKQEHLFFPRLDQPSAHPFPSRQVPGGGGHRRADQPEPHHAALVQGGTRSAPRGHQLAVPAAQVRAGAGVFNVTALPDELQEFG